MSLYIPAKCQHVSQHTHTHTQVRSSEAHESVSAFVTDVLFDYMCECQSGVCLSLCSFHSRFSISAAASESYRDSASHLQCEMTCTLITPGLTSCVHIPWLPLIFVLELFSSASNLMWNSSPYLLTQWWHVADSCKAVWLSYTTIGIVTCLRFPTVNFVLQHLYAVRAKMENIDIIWDSSEQLWQTRDV